MPLGRRDLKRLPWQPPYIRKQQSKPPTWSRRGDGRWSCDTDPWVVARRAGARRRWNAERRRKADLRRQLLMELLRGAPNPRARGLRARIARELRVHRSTISRDWRILAAELQAGEPRRRDLGRPRVHPRQSPDGRALTGEGGA